MSQVPSLGRADVRAGLDSLGLRTGDNVIVHSSLRSFGHVIGGADTIIDALLETVGRGGTVVMPTFTWGAFHAAETVVFDVNGTPSESGKITETFRRRPGVLRSTHICHSVAAYGEHAHAVLGDGIKSFGEGSTFDALSKLDAHVLLLGVDFDSCTALHAAEEILQVPYRYYRNFLGSTIILPTGESRPSRSVEFLRKDGYNNTFLKMRPLFEAAGVLATSSIGNARATLVRIRDVIRITTSLMSEDPYYLTR
jgi:aminoglycoside 3-N-acetyltransferase